MVHIDRDRLAQAARENELDLIVLFGSQASARALAGSDVDLAVRYRPGGRRLRSPRLDLAARLAPAFPPEAELDVTVLNDASSMLLFEVAREGQLLYEREPLLFWQFQSYAARRYDDDYKYRLRRERYLEKRVEQWEPEKQRSSAKN
jgi:predicted nucleotidyltransferase